jgi:hypothetical protein
MKIEIFGVFHGIAYRGNPHDTAEGVNFGGISGVAPKGFQVLFIGRLFLRYTHGQVKARRF